MSDAYRDDNGVPTWSGLSLVDGTTVVPIKVNPSNGGVKIDFTSSIAFTPRTSAARDANNVATRLGQRDGASTVLPVYVNPVTGGVLIDM